MKRKLLTAGTLLLLAACSTGENVATLNNGSISKDELYQTLLQTSGPNALYALLLQKIAVNNVTDKEALNKSVNEYINQLTQQNGGPESFAKTIKQNGFADAEAFRQYVYTNQAVAQVLKEKTVVSDEEVKAAYDKWEAPIKASHILVADETLAKSLIEKINAGEDFAALAKEHSTDTGTKENGGSLGAFKPTAMVPEFASVVKNMKTGEISQTPVKTTFGFHVIKVEENNGKRSFDEEKEIIKQEVLETKASDSQNRQTIFQELLKQANVQISNEYLKNALDPVINGSGNVPAVSQGATPTGDVTTTASQTSASEQSTSK